MSITLCIKMSFCLAVKFPSTVHSLGCLNQHALPTPTLSQKWFIFFLYSQFTEWNISWYCKNWEENCGKSLKLAVKSWIIPKLSFGALKELFFMKDPLIRDKLSSTLLYMHVFNLYFRLNVDIKKSHENLWNWQKVFGNFEFQMHKVWFIYEMSLLHRTSDYSSTALTSPQLKVSHA